MGKVIKVYREVRPISIVSAERIICSYHYSMSLPPTTYTFGLFKPELEGVCCFGLGANHTMMKGAQSQGWNFFELVRLALIHNTHNDASFMIGNSLKLLPKPTLIVSYADKRWSHAGKIYQATNWIYTGLTHKDTCFELNGKILHKKTIFGWYGTQSEKTIKRICPKIKRIADIPKHRYFYPVGTKTDKEKMRKWIDEKFGIKPYPKDITQQYDIQAIKQKIDKSKKQPTLF